MKRHHFVEKSLEGALAFAAESVFASKTASKKGLLQGLDARVKSLSLIGVVVFALFIKSLGALGVLYALSLLLAALSGISLVFFLKRTWVFIPIFSLFIVLPALFSFVTPGQTLIQLGPLTITRPGALGAALFVLRVATSVSYVLLLSMTTRHFELLKSLRFFGIPPIFVMVLGMAYRYIELFVELLSNTFLSLKSRVGTVSQTRHGQRMVAWNIASLWRRSYSLNEKVYEAMLSRGYRGEPMLLQDSKIRFRDWAWCAGLLCVCVVLHLADLRNFL